MYTLRVLIFEFFGPFREIYKLLLDRQN